MRQEEEIKPLLLSWPAAAPTERELLLRHDALQWTHGSEAAVKSRQAAVVQSQKLQQEAEKRKATAAARAVATAAAGPGGRAGSRADTDASSSPAEDMAAKWKSVWPAGTAAEPAAKVIAGIVATKDPRSPFAVSRYKVRYEGLAEEDDDWVGADQVTEQQIDEFKAMKAKAGVGVDEAAAAKPPALPTTAATAATAATVAAVAATATATAAAGAEWAPRPGGRHLTLTVTRAAGNGFGMRLSKGGRVRQQDMIVPTRPYMTYHVVGMILLNVTYLMSKGAPCSTSKTD